MLDTAWFSQWHRRSLQTLLWPTGQQADGFKSAVGAAAGMVFQMMGGMLAAYNWRFSFLGFLLVIPIALIIWFKLPDTGVKKPEKSTIRR